MKAWDMSGGAARLEESFEALRRAWLEASEHWDDQTARDFRAKHLDPVEPRVRRALDAVRRIDELFGRAYGALSDPDRGEQAGERGP